MLHLPSILQPRALSFTAAPESAVIALRLTLAILLALAAALVTPATAQNRDARTPKPYSDSAPTNPDTEFKRFHPYALKLIVRGQREEALAFLRNAPEVVRQHRDTDLLIELAEGRSSWQLDAASWPRPRTAPANSPNPPQVGDTFTIAFGACAGYVPPHERMWTNIASFQPGAFMMLGDNVYIDDPLTPELQWFHYLRRQSRPEWQALVSQVPVYAIWDDHDFSTDDAWGGPEIDHPAWKRDVWEVFKANWDNPFYGGGEANPGVWFDIRIGDVHFIFLDGRYYREDPKNENPSMLGPVQREWLEKTLAGSDATFKLLASPVPWAEGVKPGSRDTWDGYAGERQRIYDFLAQNKIDGVILLSGDRHRSDAYRIKRQNGYDLFEFCSARLTNQHVHRLMSHSLIGYNEKPSFGLLDFDLAAADPTVTYTIVNIDGQKIDSLAVSLSQLRH